MGPVVFPRELVWSGDGLHHDWSGQMGVRTGTVPGTIPGLHRAWEVGITGAGWGTGRGLAGRWVFEQAQSQALYRASLCMEGGYHSGGVERAGKGGWVGRWVFKPAVFYFVGSVMRLMFFTSIL